MRVLIFGDSNTQGFWDIEGGWVARLRRHYDEIQLQDPRNRDEPTVFNLGISGNSSGDVLQRFYHEVQARKNFEETAIVFAIGVNDSRTKAGKPYTTSQQYGSNLEELVKQAKEFTDKILFVGLTPCEEEITNPVPWGDTGYTNQRILVFEGVLQKFCGSSNIPIVTIFEALQRENKIEELFSDGLHPNSAGHQRIFELVRPKLDKLLRPSL